MRYALVALMILVAFIATAPREAEAHSGYWKVNAGNGLNVRTGPGGNYARIETMPNGTIVKAFGHSGSWLKMRDTRNGIVGWAWLAYFVPYSGTSGGTGSPPPATGGGYCMTNYWGEWVCAAAWIADTIRYWSDYYGVGRWWMFALAACESSFSPNAYNPASGVSGIYQFQPSTMQWQLPGGNVWSVNDSAHAAAKMIANGLWYHFHCLQLLGYG